MRIWKTRFKTPMIGQTNAISPRLLLKLSNFSSQPKLESKWIQVGAMRFSLCVKALLWRTRFHSFTVFPYRFSCNRRLSFRPKAMEKRAKTSQRRTCRLKLILQLIVKCARIFLTALSFELALRCFFFCFVNLNYSDLSYK